MRARAPTTPKRLRYLVVFLATLIYVPAQALVGSAAAAAPVCPNTLRTAPHATAVTLTLACFDADGNALTYFKVSGPAHGSAAVDNASTGQATYTPNLGWVGDDSFTYRAFDGTSYSNTATVVLPVQPNPGGNTPICFSSSQFVPPNTSVTLTLTCFDPNGNPLVRPIVSSPIAGSLGPVDQATGRVTYTPQPGMIQDVITFRASDGAHESNVATAYVLSISPPVSPPNSPPWCIPGFQTLLAGRSETTMMSCFDPDGPFPDPLPGGSPFPISSPYSIPAIPNNPAHGSLGPINQTLGTTTYTPNPGFAGPGDSFAFFANDGTWPFASANALFVLLQGLAPTCQDSSQDVQHNTPKAFQLNCTDPNGNPLTYSKASDPAHGTVTINASTGEATYTPNPGYGGQDSFTFRANDGTDNSNTATVSLAVSGGSGGGETCTASLRSPLPSVTHWRSFKKASFRLKGVAGGYALRSSKQARFALQVQRSRQGKKAKIKRVEFALDGTGVGKDRKAPYSTTLAPAGLALGRHTLQATVRAKKGKKRSKPLAFQVSDCEPAAFSVSMRSKRPKTYTDLDLGVRSGGPELRAVKFSLSKKLRVGLRARGRKGKKAGAVKVGTVQLTGRDGAKTTQTLTARRGKSRSLDLAGGSKLKVSLSTRGKRALTVDGLEGDGVTQVRVRLRGRRTRLLQNPKSCKTHNFAATLTATAGQSLGLKRSLKMCKSRRAGKGTS